MEFVPEVQNALVHVRQFHPDVTQVFFGVDGRWLFCGEAFDAPAFDGRVDIGLLEDAAGAVPDLPAAFEILSLNRLYQLWDQLRDIPTSDGSDQFEADAIAVPFLQFPPGTHRENIWHWFEAQDTRFLVGEVMSGIRRDQDD